MSTRPRPQAAFIQVNQSSAEQDASHSALFYLFQEVSKLASPTRSSFLDSNAPFRWTNEASGPGDLIAEKEEDSACLFHPSRDSLCRMLTYNQVNGEKEQSRSNESTTAAEPRRECRSPWKVLSLINLQCERLMHRRHVEGSDQSSVLPKDCPAAKSQTAPADAQEHGCVGPVEDVRGVIKTQPQSSVEVLRNCGAEPQAPVKAETGRRELAEDDAAASSQCQHADKREAGFSVKRQLVLNPEFDTEKSLSQQDILRPPFCDSIVPSTHLPSASQNTKLTLDSNEDACGPLSEHALILDCNANIVLTTEPPCDTKLTPLGSILPSSHFFNTSECQSSPEQDIEIMGPRPESTHAEEPPTVSAPLQSYGLLPATSKQDLSVVQGVEVSPPPTQQCKTKTPRKQPHPSRSVDIQDPDLQGVTFRMDTEMDDTREQCRLLITSKYRQGRKELCKSVRKPRMRTRITQKSIRSSSSEEESDTATNVSKDKVCASCCTRKTPMWRDAEDGTPLCNACGIRYKKYRVRCVNCWHIPRKEGNSNSCCLKCGNFVKLTSAQRKHTT